MAVPSNSTALPDGKNFSRRSILSGLMGASIATASVGPASAEAEPQSVRDRINYHGAAFIAAIKDMIAAKSGGTHTVDFYLFNEEETDLCGIVYRIKGVEGADAAAAS